jgi:hypothetical protein
MILIDNFYSKETICNASLVFDATEPIPTQQ